MAYPSASEIQGNDVGIRDPTKIAAIASSQSFQDIELIAVDEIGSEPVKSRSKLRIPAIMTGLYVRPYHPPPLDHHLSDVDL